MSFLKSSYYNAVATGITITTRLIVNKITALFIGPEGFAIYGQFKDFVALGISFCQLGTENGVIKHISENKSKPKELKKIISTSLKINTISSFVILALVLFFKKKISVLLFQDSLYENHIIIIGGSLFFIALHNLILSVLNGLQSLKKYIFISITSTILTSILSVISVYFYQLNGLIFSIALNHLVVFTISIMFALKKLNLKISVTDFNLKYFKKMLNFSLMSLSGMISLSLSLLFIRTLIINTEGTNAAGIWDSVWRISALYLLFLNSSFKFYILPTFSSLRNTELKSELFKIWKITFPVILVITCSIYFSMSFWIPFLFSKEFIAISSIILFQLLGDIIKIHSWTLGNILIAKSQTKGFVLTQIIWAIIFCFLSYLLIKSQGLQGITIAYFLSYLAHFLIQNIAVKNILWFPKNY
ncbi:O-antigen translocase [Aestuariibaculum suncheonense]|uniref:O-antigen translocase n=1 Tax=Aestuariibaculum suncheonense TaxID=1028745 RepID=A0A8J6Q4Y8_9FLAO|nr:O-antigen translocase [Aestuariibaculum suncheonense]MBD0834502.1 O-antigen translocase [Aestuariibaculum suncheonense]